MSILIISVVLATLLVLFGFVVFTPNVKSESFLLNSNATIDNNLHSALKMFGGDVSALIPRQAKQAKRRNRKLQRLFVTSGNPWNLTITEFFVTQVLLCGGSILLSALMAVILRNTISPALLGILVVGLIILAYQYPVIYYKSVSNDRMDAFKKELPEALDFLYIATSGGTYSLAQSISLVRPYLQKGVMKDEFDKIAQALYSGQSLNVALAEFGKRAPTEGIEAFVNSLNNAARLSSPVAEILKNRSEASRKERTAEIDRQIATLGTKVLLVFGPMAYISVLILVIAPTAASLMTLL